MTARKKKKVEKHHDVFEKPEALQEQISKFEEFINNHKTTVFLVLGFFVVAFAVIFAYRYYIRNQNDSAQREMFQAVYYYEMDSINLALNGDGNNFGFVEIIDEYGLTDAANLAYFYAGSCYLKLGNFGQAIEHFSDFNSNDLLIQARAYSLIGDAYMELNDFNNAAEHYTLAADYKPNKFFTPPYLIKAALAYEKLSDLQNAKKMYDRIVEEFFDSTEVQEAKKQSARIEALIAS